MYFLDLCAISVPCSQRIDIFLHKPFAFEVTPEEMTHNASLLAADA